MDLSAARSESRAALDELLAAAEAAEENWTTPAAPGKWCPAQVTEHIARVYEDAANMIEGRPHGFPKMPRFVRPVARRFLLQRTIRSGNFPKAKTFKPFDPIDGPESPAAARQRLVAAHERYERACAECSASDGTITSSVFGRVPVGDYMRFNTMHTRHHVKQISTN